MTDDHVEDRKDSLDNTRKLADQKQDEAQRQALEAAAGDDKEPDMLRIVRAL